MLISFKRNDFRVFSLVSALCETVYPIRKVLPRCGSQIPRGWTLIQPVCHLVIRLGRLRKVAARPGSILKVFSLWGIRVRGYPYHCFFFPDRFSKFLGGKVFGWPRLFADRILICSFSWKLQACPKNMARQSRWKDGKGAKNFGSPFSFRPSFFPAQC